MRQLQHPDNARLSRDTPSSLRHIEHIGDATLYLGDCREIAPTLEFNVVITDPVWPNCPAGLIAGSDDPWTLWATAVRALRAAYRMIVVMRCDSDPRFLTSIPQCYPFLRSIQLPYAIPGYIGRVLGGDETAYWFGDPIRWGSGRRVIPGRAPIAQPNDRPRNEHPMSRAQVHFDWLAYWASDEDEVICDPFMGSGTTGIGALRQGRKFIGIEIEPRYFDLACRRIEAETRQGWLLENIGESEERTTCQ